MSEATAQTRVRVKFGEHEFESEGPFEAVKAHFLEFRRLVAPQNFETNPARQTPEPGKPSLSKIVLLQNRIAFLKIATKPEDTVLLLLLAQRLFLENEDVTGAEIMEGLRLSGISIPRADHIVAKHALRGYVIQRGLGRARRYQLSDSGVERAQRIAAEVLSLTH